MYDKQGVVYGQVFDEIKVQSMHSPSTKYVIRLGNVGQEMVSFDLQYMFLWSTKDMLRDKVTRHTI